LASAFRSEENLGAYNRTKPRETEDLCAAYGRDAVNSAAMAIPTMNLHLSPNASNQVLGLVTGNTWMQVLYNSSVKQTTRSNVQTKVGQSCKIEAMVG
jgi:hypothetical protein